MSDAQVVKYHSASAAPSSVTSSSGQGSDSGFKSDDECTSSAEGVVTKTVVHNKVDGELFVLAQRVWEGTVRLQARVRGTAARRHYQRLRRAACCLQRWARPMAHRLKYQRAYNQRRQCQAACRIQTVYRGWAAAEFYELQRFAIVILQAQVRRIQARNRTMEKIRQLQLRKTVIDQPPEATNKLNTDESVHSSSEVELIDYTIQEVTMPDLESMGAPSESNDNSSDASDISVVSGVESGDDTVVTSNVFGLETAMKRPKMTMNNAARGVIFSLDEGETELSASLPPLRFPPESLIVDNASSSVVFSSLKPPPPCAPPPSQFISRNGTLNHTSFNGMLNEIDVDETFDDEYEQHFRQKMHKVSLIFTLFLVISCFILPVALLVTDKSAKNPNPKPSSEKPPQQPVGRMLADIIAPTIPSASLPKPVPRRMKDRTKRASRQTKSMAMVNFVTEESRPRSTLSTPMRAAPAPRALTAMTRRSGPTANHHGKNPTEPWDLFSMSLDASPPEAFPSSSSSSIEVPQASAVSESVATRTFLPVGQQIKAVSQKLVDMLQSTKIKDSVEQHSRGIFSPWFRVPRQVEARRQRPPFMEEESLKVAKCAHLSLITEWGLTVTRQENKEQARQKRATAIFLSTPPKTGSLSMTRSRWRRPRSVL